MKLKSLIFVLLFPLVMGVIFCACCHDVTPFFKINKVFFKFNPPFTVTKTVEDSVVNDLPKSVYVSYDAIFVADANPFISGATALTCLQPGHAGLKDVTIVAIDVTTLFDYDDKHLKGSKINDITSIGNSGNPTTFTAIGAHSDGFKIGIFNDKKLVGNPANFKIKPFQLSVKMTLSDSTKLDAETEFIYFLDN